MLVPVCPNERHSLWTGCIRASGCHCVWLRAALSSALMPSARAIIRHVNCHSLTIGQAMMNDSAVNMNMNMNSNASMLSSPGVRTNTNLR